MTRRQLRPFRDADGEAAWYAARYPAGYDHAVWPDHRLRVRATVELAAAALADVGRLASVADLSCGDGTIPVRLAAHLGASRLVLGDAVSWAAQAVFPPPGTAGTSLRTVTGTLPGTVAALDDGVDAYVCSETLEHLPDPDGLLGLLRPRVRFLVVSTPVDAWGDENPEHYWAWSADDVTVMLGRAGFDSLLVATVDPRAYYTFGIWVCR